MDSGTILLLLKCCIALISFFMIIVGYFRYSFALIFLSFYIVAITPNLIRDFKIRELIEENLVDVAIEENLVDVAIEENLVDVAIEENLVDVESGVVKKANQKFWNGLFFFFLSGFLILSAYEMIENIIAKRSRIEKHFDK